MPVAAADLRTVELVVRGRAAVGVADAQTIINLFHYRRVSTVVDAVKANVITGFHDSVVTTLALALSANYSVASIGCRWLEDVEDPYLDVDQTDVGAIVGDALSVKLAVFVQKKTAIRGRRGMGGWHFGPLAESQVNTAEAGNPRGAEILTDAAKDLFVDVADAVMAGFASSEGNNWVPVLWSKSQSDMAAVPADIITRDLVQCKVRRSLGSQLSRKVLSIY